MEAIKIKGVVFQPEESWHIHLKRHDIITPIWKYGKCVRILITRRETGEAIYIDTNTKQLRFDIPVNAIYTPHGVTYLLLEDVWFDNLSTQIAFFSDKQPWEGFVKPTKL